MVLVEVVLVETVKLTCEDICHHKPHCDYEKGWMQITLPNYSTYSKASAWLRNERKYKLISVAGEFDPGRRFTGRYTFRFLCEQECILFALRWS